MGVGGYPAGAAHDSRAPYNDTSELCEYCDRDEIEDMAADEEELEQLLNNASKCDDCIAEHVHDWLQG